ncbi:uncharacterized protein LOC125541028 [Triticum urartu]|uniref:uncharacterized protein LOC125541028 n=1 Tax=Triticum urartu TaxID=4572 RepID=UPI00204377FC|nr:uncharacterized protein LOC125541028 [Triticum urartu]
MEASAAARGERVATATRGESAAVQCDVVRAKSMVVAETRRSRRTCVVAQRSRRLGATTVKACGTEPQRPRRTCVVAQRLRWRGMAAWRCCAAVEAAAVQGNKPRRRVGRDRCVLWVRTRRVGRVGTAGARMSVRLTLGGGVCRRCVRVRARVRLHPSGVCRWRLPWRTRRRRAMSPWRVVWSGLSSVSDVRETCGTHWCGRARRVCAGHAGRRGTPDVCRLRRRSSACVAEEEDEDCVTLGGGRSDRHGNDVMV